MKIVMVSIPNHHFFQWVNQLKRSGHEVFWFDISDSGNKSERIQWVHQIQGWKLKYDYPLRHFLKNNFPRIYNFFQKYNERKVATVFRKLLDEIQPDVVHSFAMQLSCLPILEVMQQHNATKWIYSSWGSDIFFHTELGIQSVQFTQILQRVNYLITDCHRDAIIAEQNGFKNTFLGVYMGNGGLDIEKSFIENPDDRNVIIIKGYEDGIGKALKVIEAIELLPISLFDEFEIIIYSADLEVVKRVKKSPHFSLLKVKIYKRGQFIANADLLQLMGKSVVHIANSLSDGLPTSAVEAMAMGAFPIQSNPGKVSEEVITHGLNGFLIENPLDSIEIAKWIESAIVNPKLRANAQKYNVNFVDKNYNREQLEKKIVKLYESIS
ncbi:glycosyltransferase family 4 protein [Flavobacterium sp.]|uniref:glycosyltransferase family 4 protein n=1 Tax=Flavobacterium sp. TaxID=239 RepID=UPI003751729C